MHEHDCAAPAGGCGVVAALLPSVSPPRRSRRSYAKPASRPEVGGTCLLRGSVCSLIGFSQNLSVNQQCFSFTTNQHQSDFSIQKPTSEQTDISSIAIRPAARPGQVIVVGHATYWSSTWAACACPRDTFCLADRGFCPRICWFGDWRVARGWYRPTAVRSCGAVCFVSSVGYKSTDTVLL